MTIERFQQSRITVDDDKGWAHGVAVWAQIVSELAALQDAAPLASSGSVVNPVTGRPYVVDTCCAAAVFAAEYRRTANRVWEERADAALTAAQSGSLMNGISEPTWDALGWHEVPESLPATGIAVDAYWDASNRLGRLLDADHIEDLSDFLLRCRSDEGGFVHNALQTGQEAPEVQNASASALDLLGRMASGAAAEHRGHMRPDATLRRLADGQIASGFWPYRYPGHKLRLRELLTRWPFRALFRAGRFDSYFGYGDITHHLMTLYSAAGFLASSGFPTDAQMLASGWHWVKERLVPDGQGCLIIDWSGDPAPRSPQYSNTRDTNAYFLLVGTLPLLASVGIVAQGEARAVAEALLAHVDTNLMSERGHVPCVKPYEGPNDVVRNILPMFEQSVAWKGRLLTEFVLARSGAAGTVASGANRA